MAKTKTRMSEEVHLHGHAPKRRKDRGVAPDEKDGGMWFVVMRELEHDGVHYMSLNHHLVQTGNIPERVPSSGAKSSRVGDNTVPVDATGMINLAGMSAGQIYALCQSRTVAPVKMTDKIKKLLFEGSRDSANVVPQMIPPMKRIANLSQHISQITGENLPKFGGTNHALFEKLMKGFPGGLTALPVGA